MTEDEGQTIDIGASLDDLNEVKAAVNERREANLAARHEIDMEMRELDSRETELASAIWSQLGAAGRRELARLANQDGLTQWVPERLP